MLLLLSPAKKLDYDSPVRTTLHTQPLFVEQSAALIKVLKKKTAGDVADLMKLSDTPATLNVGRYAAWKPVFDQTNSRQAALAFNGDVRSEEHTSELQSLMRTSYAVFCLKKKKHKH